MSSEWKEVPAEPDDVMVQVLEQSLIVTSKGTLLNTRSALVKVIAAAPKRQAPPPGYAPCSPALLAAGVDCATAPRWTSEEPDGHSHWHPEPGKPAESHLADLARVADGTTRHDFNGLCPDEVEGHYSRDPDCPACKVLIAYDRLSSTSN